MHFVQIDPFTNGSRLNPATPNSGRVCITRISLVVWLILLGYSASSLAVVSDAAFFTYLDLDYPGLETVRSHVNSADYGSAKSELLKYYQNRPKTAPGRQYFSQPTTGDKYRADRNCEHWFQEGDDNSNWYFVGTDIDWYKNPSGSVDPGWLYGFYYHRWLPNLGAVYAQTRDEKYAKEWIEAITDWIADVGDDPANFYRYHFIYIQSWIKSYQYFIHDFRSPSITPDQHIVMLKALKDNADKLAAGQVGDVLEFVTLSEIAVMFPEFSSASAWLETAAARLESAMKSNFYLDGVEKRQAPDYVFLTGSWPAIADGYGDAYQLAQINGLSPFSATFKDLLEAAYVYRLFLTKPDKWLPPIADTDNFLDNNRCIGAGAEIFDRDDMRYVFTSGADGTPPEEVSKDFPDGGHYIMRSGWGTPADFDQQFYLGLLVGPFGGWHDHFDWLSFDAYAYGRNLIIDAGLFSYEDVVIDGVNWHYFARRTASHNTITVDGKDQVTYVQGGGNGTLPEYETKEWLTNAGFDFVDATVSSANYDVDHERKIFFVRNEYWIVSDFLTGSGDHSFDLYYHLPSKCLEKTTLDATSKAVHSSENRLIIVPADPAALSASVIKDWVSEKGDGWSQVKVPAPTVKYSKNGAAATTFETIIYPYPGTAPAIAVSRLTVTRNGTPLSSDTASGLRIEVDGNQDYYLLAHDQKAPTEYGTFRSDTGIAYLRKDSGGTITNIQIKNGTELKEDETILATTYGVDSNISSSNNKVEIVAPGQAGSVVSRFHIWCPGSISVKINGKSVGYEQNGNYVDNTTGEIHPEDGGNSEEGANQEDSGVPDGGADAQTNDRVPQGSLIEGGCGCQSAAYPQVSLLIFGFFIAARRRRLVRRISTQMREVC